MEAEQAQPRDLRLVQRVQKRSRKGDGSGVDAYFAFDYMGSAEFEFGTLPHSLGVMRTRVNTILPLPEPAANPAWFYGRIEDLPIALALLKDQLGEEKWRLKERSQMKGSYAGRKYDQEVIAWWAVQEKYRSSSKWYPFVIFQKKEDAESWSKGIDSKSK